MALFSLNIKDKKFKVAVADTPESRAKGLSGLKRLGENKGMLFVFPDPQRMVMVMKGMKFGLDFVFLDENWEIRQLGSLDNNPDHKIIAIQPYSMVLELPKGTIEELGLTLDMTLKPSGPLSTHCKGVKKFKTGGKFEMIGEKVYKVKVDDVKPEAGRLQVLNDGGEVVANIDSGARIFSRPHTKELISKLKSGDKKALAEAMIKILDIQDNQEQDYVTND